MPNSTDHLRYAEEHESFSNYLITQNKYLGWAITGVFYAAIHYIEAFLATVNIHSSQHRTRDSIIAKNENLREVFQDFQELKNYSIQARYYGSQFTSEIVHERLENLKSLKNHILSLTT